MTLDDRIIPQRQQFHLILNCFFVFEEQSERKQIQTQSAESHETCQEHICVILSPKIKQNKKLYLAYFVKHLSEAHCF